MFNKRKAKAGMIISSALFVVALAIITICANIGYWWDVFFMKLCVVTAFTAPLFFCLSLFIFMVVKKREEKSSEGYHTDKN